MPGCCLLMLPALTVREQRNAGEITRPPLAVRDCLPYNTFSWAGCVNSQQFTITGGVK